MLSRDIKNFELPSSVLVSLWPLLNLMEKMLEGKSKSLWHHHLSVNRNFKRRKRSSSNLTSNIKGCVCYIFAGLFCKFKGEHLQARTNVMIPSNAQV